MASKNVFRILWFSLALLLAGVATASAEGRHALVVGINDYAHVAPLRKAVNDARAMDKALTAAGFKVQLVEGPDQIGFLEAIAKFSASVGPGDEAVVYYAGHGVEIDGQNYLLPADVPAAAAGQEIVLTNRSISVQDLVDALQARGARMSLLILDACRDNPFPRSGTRSIGGTRGLAPAPKAEGTFILYSAGEGETALDRLSDGDPNPNSVFTRALVPLIAEPGLPLREVSRRVRSEVRQMAQSVDHAQFPAVYDQLDGDFSFTAASATGAVVTPDPCAAARTDWALVAESESVKALEGFIAAYPGCPVFVGLAEGRLDGATIESCEGLDLAWKDVNAASFSSLEAFLLRFDGCSGSQIETAKSTLFDLNGEMAERSLRLSRREIVHITLALYAFVGERSKPVFAPVSGEGHILARSPARNFLQRFVREKGLSASGVERRYLDRGLISHLLYITKVKPSEAPKISMLEVESTGHWVSGITARTCEIQSAAETFSDNLVQTTPNLRAIADKTGSDNQLRWSMVEPLPFDPSSDIAAFVSGKRFDLSLGDGNSVQPAHYAGGTALDDALTNEMTHGTAIAIQGKNVLTGEPLTITFYLDGFESAFQRMASLCNRPALLDWIE